jgi:hypothetical protein
MNIHIVIQPPCFGTNRYSLPTFQRYILQLMEFNMLWTMCLENTLENMIETCLPKLKPVLGTYETWWKQRNLPKKKIKYMVDLMLLWETFIMNNLVFFFLFYFNEWSIIKTLNIHSVLQPHHLIASPCSLPTL